MNETYNAVRLIGRNTAEEFGLARSLSVMPGDEINMEVWAKYLDPDPENWQGAFESFLEQYASGGAPAGTIVDGGVAGSIGNAVFPYAALLERDNLDETAPKAFLTWLVFDRDFNPLIEESGFVQLGSSGVLPKENGTNVAHELLKRATPLKIKKAGYVYIYLSNENETPVEVFFDDFKVEHIKSPVVQMDDYYPFGLTFNSYQRENSVGQDYLYNGKEKQDELGLGWLDYGARMYMPEIGRWGSVDPRTELVYHWTPYRYGYNNPIRFFDRDGMTEEERQKAVEWVRAYMKAHGKDAYTLYTNDCASLMAGGIKSTGNFGDLREGPGIRGFGNGVARIVSMARAIKKNEAREGDILTFKTERKTHQGVDGEFDHIGMVTKVNVDEKGNVIGYRVIQTGSSGTKEIDIDLNKDKDWMQLKGAWQWDTEEEDNNVYQGAELEPVVITGEKIERKERVPGGWTKTTGSQGELLIRIIHQNF